ncbi:competence protein ComGG [Evansella caseinilytica]|uniref:Competence protein ComGG n=1 Tax=Evansella caseinilytica TaxID=1503961 RepID=A0A1H3KT19_9BACI|nr:competence type IV pilus minor pilin ComGG [Evansella caseinilytica]SDY55312.1 competence protein ComGG [Evansella caseinilytica]
MKNEKGMALLLTVVMLFVLTSLLLHLLSVYESEKLFLQMEKDWHSLDHLLLTGMEEVLSLLEQGKSGDLAAGKLNYSDGVVHYQITRTAGSEQTIFLQAELFSGRTRHVKMTRNAISGEIAQWVEGG